MKAQEAKMKKAERAKKGKEVFDKIIARLEEEYQYCAVPFRKNLYIYLFAKLEGLEPTKEIAELLKSNESYRESIEYEEDKYNQLLGDFPKDVHGYIISQLLLNLEPKEKEYVTERAMDEAYSKVLDALSDWTTEELLYLAGWIESGVLGTAIKKVVSEKASQTIDLEAVAV